MNLKEDDKLPQGWANCMLDDLLITIQSGSRPKGGVKGITDGIPSLGGEHLTYSGGFNFSSIRYVPESFANKMTRGNIQEEDILIVKDGATTGKTAYVDKTFPFKKAVINEHIFICRASKLIDSKCLFYYLISKQGQDQILSNFQGSAQGGINLSFAPNTEVILPPLNEQKRIVAKLEKLLAKVNESCDRLSRIPTILKRFRQSVLASACSGRLTADWRKSHPDIESADELLKRIQQERLDQAKTPAQKSKIQEIYLSEETEDNELLPESWNFITLNKLCISFDYGTSQKSLKEGKVPVLRMGNIQDGEIDWNDLVYSSDENEINKYNLSPNTVLFNRTNSAEKVGKTAIYRGDRSAIFAGYLIRINNCPELDPEYLNYCLNTPYAKSYCNSVKSDGVNQSNINAQKLAKFEIPFCAIEEQKEIVKRVKALFKKCDLIEQRYLKAKTYTDKLTQSILAKAFRGELVPQDSNDEPAEVLLERIREEKTLTEKSSKGKKRTKSKTT
ncbi:restriction endonuclease subunit S [Cyanobacterium aponinum]|uniref:restriction endonuclease subunit S n=1 Tax=Cyanobacterium aponinum TaxID=379064 RepID=UPI0019D4D711|nr:restriction endonuclease subunit S [Cyanobacterium aponinum]